MFKVKGRWIVNAGRTLMDLQAGMYCVIGAIHAELGKPGPAALSYTMAGLSFAGARAVNYLANKQEEEWKKEYDLKQIKKIAKKHETDEMAYPFDDMYDLSKKPFSENDWLPPEHMKNELGEYKLPKSDADFDFYTTAAKDAIDILNLNKMKSAAEALANLLDDGEHDKIESNLYKTLDGLKNGEVNLETYNDGKIFYEVADKLKTAGVIPDIDLGKYGIFSDRECFVPDCEDSIDNTYYENGEYMVEPGVPEQNDDIIAVFRKKKRGIHSLIPTKPSKSKAKGD